MIIEKNLGIKIQSINQSIDKSQQKSIKKSIETNIDEFNQWINHTRYKRINLKKYWRINQSIDQSANPLMNNRPKTTTHEIIDQNITGWIPFMSTSSVGVIRVSKCAGAPSSTASGRSGPRIFGICLTLSATSAIWCPTGSSRRLIFSRLSGCWVSNKIPRFPT